VDVLNLRLPGAALLALLALLVLLSAAPAQAEQAAEHRVKAAYLYKFGGYVEWPAEAFEREDSPFVIGVLDADALAEELARITQGRRFNQRPILVRKLRDGDSLTGLHVLYLGSPDPQRIAAALSAIRGQPTLTVTASDETRGAGSVINFVVVDNRVRFDVSLAPADRQLLKISSLLLAVARRVDG
jgi:hypothetical protein